MKKTYRLLRGYIAYSIIIVLMFLWLIFDKIYPLLVKTIAFIHFPFINPNIFLLAIGFIVFILLVTWSIRNKLWFGISFSLQYYLMIKQLRRHIKDAQFSEEREYDNRFVFLPKIKIVFNNKYNRKTGRVFIQNSIKFDKKLENLRIDSALKGYISERNYLSNDRDWYIFEFYSLDTQNQYEITTIKQLIKWSNETANDYELRLDERTTVPIHHMGLGGVTGSGKSFFLQMLCEQIVSKKKHELFIIDPKSSDVYQMARRIVSDDRIARKVDAIKLIKIFYSQLEERQVILEKYSQSHRNKTYKDAGLPALILLIDEFGALRETWKSLPKKERDEVDSILAEIAFVGRSNGAFIWLISQQLNAQTIPTAIRDQLVLKIVLGESDEQTYRTLFDSGVSVPPILFGPGQGIFSFPGIASTNKPKLLSVPYCSFLNENT